LTVPYNAAGLSAAQASALNSGYAAYNGGLQVAKNNGLITETERLARTNYSCCRRKWFSND
jgi:hypothetical protein